MEGETDLPAPTAEAKFSKPNPSPPININPDSITLCRSFNPTSTSISTTSSASSSPPDLVRHVQAAFKRHRPLGMMQSNGIRPRRFLVSQRETSKESSLQHQSTVYVKKTKEDISQDHMLRGSIPQSKVIVTDGRDNQCGDNQQAALITPPSDCSASMNVHEENIKPCNTQSDQPQLSTNSRINDVVSSSGIEPGNALVEVQKKVHFSTGNIATPQETEWDVSNQVDTSAAGNEDWQHHNFQSMEVDNSLRSEGRISSLLARRTMGVEDQPHQLGNFSQNDLSNAMTQSSMAGSCVTSTLMNSTSAPMISSTTYSLQPHMDGAHLGTEPAGEAEVQHDAMQPSYSLSGNAGRVSHQSAVTSQAVKPISAMPTEVDKSSCPLKELLSNLPHDHEVAKGPCCDEVKRNVTDVQSQSALPKVPPSDVKLEISKSQKLERGASSKAASTSRKKNYDPDLFFKVNEKLYQRLGKIGSGGSSEVHKVISSDCTIYALKKIKLKGRDYATAYGFCQEIEYLNRLRGKSNIIQLIDYEVTDKNLLQEVMNGSSSNRDGRVRDDGYIYMVLEYGEIDLAHMLAQKWKELDDSNAFIDENWLRFYWQQILLAVNTIHEERIVHSDLKPANFLLVRGSLKLIDFGIAKAIMSDTTNIQRDSQVGTLSYMSPEAFMCNEVDADGNTVKCGRPSDIWSLGCILYQMVYGRTPFAEYKTFWAKFKVITDPNHEIVYEPMSNPWLLDLMKKCLAWDRNKRWRIPQLIQHPFLVPPQLPSPPHKSCTLFQLIAESSANDHKALMLCSQLESMLMDPKSVVQPDSSVARDQLRKLLCKISTVSFQLQEQLSSL